MERKLIDTQDGNSCFRSSAARALATAQELRESNATSSGVGTTSEPRRAIDYRTENKTTKSNLEILRNLINENADKFWREDQKRDCKDSSGSDCDNRDMDVGNKMNSYENDLVFFTDRNSESQSLEKRKRPESNDSDGESHYQAFHVPKRRKVTDNSNSSGNSILNTRHQLQAGTGKSQNSNNGCIPSREDRAILSLVGDWLEDSIATVQKQQGAQQTHGGSPSLATTTATTAMEMLSEVVKLKQTKTITRSASLEVTQQTQEQKQSKANSSSTSIESEDIENEGSTFLPFLSNTERTNAPNNNEDDDEDDKKTALHYEIGGKTASALVKDMSKILRAIAAVSRSSGTEVNALEEHNKRGSNSSNGSTKEGSLICNEIFENEDDVDDDDDDEVAEISPDENYVEQNLVCRESGLFDGDGDKSTRDPDEDRRQTTPQLIEQKVALLRTMCRLIRSKTLVLTKRRMRNFHEKTSAIENPL